MQTFNTIDHQQRPAAQLVLDQLATDPVAPVEGQIWENTVSNQVKCVLNGQLTTLGLGTGPSLMTLMGFGTGGL